VEYQVKRFVEVTSRNVHETGGEHTAPQQDHRVPNMFIIGAPKCGTTSMYQYLKGHPQIFLPDYKEPSYFAADFAAGSLGNVFAYGLHEKQYYDLFADAGDAKVVGEGSTHYLYSADAPRLIRGVSPDAKIVVMLRNPVDMMHSLHAQRVASEFEDLRDFEEALRADDERRQGPLVFPIPPGVEFVAYRDKAMYGSHLKRWFDTFGRDHVHVTIFEEMLDRPGTEFQSLLEFLEVDPTYRPSSFAVHNPARAPRSVLLRRLLNTDAALWLRWRALAKVIGEDRARSINHRLRDSRLQWRKAQHGHVRPEVRRQLEADFAPDLELLSRELGRDMHAVWFGRQGDG
jgi:Sulfotransferase domain